MVSATYRVCGRDLSSARSSTIAPAIAMILGLLLAVGCGAHGATPAAAPVAPEAPPADPMLRHVPADAPWVLAMLEPIPEQIYDLLIPSVGADSGIYDPALQALRANPHRTPLENLWMGYLDTLRGMPSGEVADRMGLGKRPRLVVYGLPLYPALRAEVADSGRLFDTLTGLVGRAQMHYSVSHRADQLLLQIELTDTVHLAIAFPSTTEIAAAIYPAADEERYLRHVLGEDLPSRSLGDSGALTRLEHDHGLLPHMIGTVDTAGLIAALGPVTGIDPACDGDAARLAALVPRLVFGYEQLDARGMVTILRAVVDPAIVDALEAVRVEVPGLADAAAGHPLAVVGGGLDLQAAAVILGRTQDLLGAHPFRCPALRSLDRLAGQLAFQIRTQIPPPLDEVLGGRVTLDDVEVDPSGAHVLAHGVVVAGSTAPLVDAAASVVPQLAAVADDGAPVVVSTAGFQVSWLGDVAIARRGRLLGFATGPAALAAVEHEVAGAGDREVAGRSPLLLIGYDVLRILELSGATSTLPGGDSGMVTQFYRNVSFLVMSVDVDPRGVALRLGVSFDAR
ncbi:MAG: hypothetical protein H6708_16045 [Kofleriaceae bacterium]|nr:hypothetical protein [Myxococcales bacterium]MCB9561916.1 hypothetical protein [Kofleriaceae bacterium]